MKKKISILHNSELYIESSCWPINERLLLMSCVHDKIDVAFIVLVVCVQICINNTLWTIKACQLRFHINSIVDESSLNSTKPVAIKTQLNWWVEFVSVVDHRPRTLHLQNNATEMIILTRPAHVMSLDDRSMNDDGSVGSVSYLFDASERAQLQ